MSPQAIAVACGAQTLSYAELHRRAARLSHRLQARGVGPGQVVAVLLERSLDLSVALLAVVQSGAAYLPVAPEYPAQRIAHLLSDAQPAALISSRALLASVPQPPALTLLLDDDAADIAAYPADGQPAATGPEDPLYLIYTSTGAGQVRFSPLNTAFIV